MFYSWLTSSLVRNYPQTAPKRSKQMKIKAALNEKFSFQIALRLMDELAKRVKIEVEGPDGWSIRIRRVGYVPVAHHNYPHDSVSDISPLDMEGIEHIPGYVPDPLFDEASMLLPTNETHSFWLSIVPGKNAEAALYPITVKVLNEDEVIGEHVLEIQLQNITLPKVDDFHITHWFYVDSIIDWYKTDMFDDRFWELFTEYVKNVVEHGQDTLYVPVFTPPLDGVKRPSQLLKVKKTGKDKYKFDWSDVKEYIKIAKKCGIKYFEWCHPFTQWGVKNAIRIYEDQGKDETLLWEPETSATSATYKKFLSQYCPELKKFLDGEKILKKSFFHVSDEPHGDEHLDNYKKARKLLNEVAPWMTVMDALSDIEYGRQKLTDIPVPSISTALAFVEEGIPCWCYYCCGPRGKYLNRLMDTPLAKIAMHGFLFYRWPFQGFLHWGYNYWYKSQTRQLIDPYTIQDGMKWENGWSYGDTFVVYPGENGPVDSIRWEVFAESLQDYALLKALKFEKDHKLLGAIKTFEDFPKTEKWRTSTREKCYALIGQ